MDAAERKDDLAAGEGLGFAAGTDGDASSAAIIEGNVGHRRAAEDGEIFAGADVGGEIAEPRRGALAGPVADRNDGKACPEVGFHVGKEWKLPLLGESFPPIGNSGPLFP